MIGAHYGLRYDPVRPVLYWWQEGMRLGPAPRPQAHAVPVITPPERQPILPAFITAICVPYKILMFLSLTIENLCDNAHPVCTSDKRRHSVVNRLSYSSEIQGQGLCDMI